MLYSLILFLTSFLAQAMPMEQRPVYSSARYLARGGAMSADVDDYNLIFVNPAGLPLLKEDILNFEFQLEGSGGITENLTTYFGYDDKWKVMDPADIQALRNRTVATRLSFLGAYLTKSFAFAIISKGTLDTAYDNLSLPGADVFCATDLVAQLSYGRAFLDGKLRFGGTGKIAYRSGRFGHLTMTELQNQGVKPTGTYSQEGIAFSFDAGGQYSWFMKDYDISLGFVALDLSTPYGIDPRITNSKENGRPPILPARMDIGVGFKVHNIGQGITWRNNFDIIKSFTKMESNFLDLIHLGTELQFPRLLFLRAGLYQSYWSAGLGVKYYILQCDFATYAANTAIYNNTDGRRRSDRRYTFQVSFLF